MAKKAFVIGINTLGLKYCLNDAVLMDDCLTLHGYDVITFKTAKDKRYILDQFDILIDDCDKTDTLIFYFSGHGVIHKGNLRLILADDTSKRSSRLEMREITDAFDDCAASSKLIILDCCHAGTVHADWNPVSSEFYRLLTASERLEKAKETDSLEAGFMTYHIHQCLINPPSETADDNNIIRIGSLYKQLVRAAEKHIGSDDPVKVPIPNLLGNAKADFEIATKMADHKSGVDETKQVLQEQKAEQRYQELALESCDIVDLANLPESDRHIATRQRELQLRRLYVALRVKIEISFDMEADEDDLRLLKNAG